MKVLFLQTEWDNRIVLETYKKMTPNKSGKWEDLEATLNPKEADYFVVIDYTKQNVPLDKTIFINAHPYNSEGYRDYTNIPCAAWLDCRKTFGFGEWWLNFDYDVLSNMNPPFKHDRLCSIVSNNRRTFSHKYKINRLEEFCKNYNDCIDVYGRIVPNTESNINKCYKYATEKKEQVLTSYKYALEFDEINDEHYFSERIFDDILMWTIPIYAGCRNLDKYIPQGSFLYLENMDDEDIYSVVLSNFWNNNLDKLKQARELLLNKWQLWPRVLETIRTLK